MARNGSGGFSLLINTWNPATTGVSATVTDWQALINDIATAMQQSVSSDGQTAMTGNLAMGNNKLTGLAAGTATGHSLRWEQLFSQGTIANLASATTTDIGAQNTSFLNITGTTTITGFGTNYNGPRYLGFAGILTLTHSATLVCPGAANITTAANDSAIAIPISGGWQIVAYQKASGLPVSTAGLAASGANTDITSLNAPALGAATATTAAGSTNTTQVATTAMVQAAIPLSTAITGVRRIAQIQSTQTGAVATGTTIIPQDDTIPQITEGDEYMTVAITPTSAGSTLEVDVSIMTTNSVLTWNIAALFRDSTANALASAMVFGAGATTGGFITFRHRVSAGSTSATTFRVRAGGSAAGTTTFNGVSGGRQLGGVMASSITVTEVLA